MVNQKITITNASGLHARPASELAKVCSRCQSEITISTREKIVNPKSVLMLMSAAIRSGTEVVVECSGDTEKEDLETILCAIAGGLGE